MCCELILVDIFSPTDQLFFKRAEQVFDRRSAVKLYRIVTAEHGVVNLDVFVIMSQNRLMRRGK